jgi:hypothetical protein
MHAGQPNAVREVPLGMQTLPVILDDQIDRIVIHLFPPPAGLRMFGNISQHLLQDR